MKKQVHIFFAALMFLTRLPIPKWVRHETEYLQKSTRYFTVVGAVVGVILAALYFLLDKFLPTSTAILLTMACSLLLTGAFHEDGFADMCDAFGGGYTKEKILEIMKDSRLGTYGVAGLFMMLTLKFVLWQQLAESIFYDQFTLVSVPYYLHFPIIIILGQSISRLMPILIIQSYDYVYQQDVSKSKPLASEKLGVGSVLLATVFSMIGFVFLPAKLLIALVPMGIATIYMGRLFYKNLQGYTGDCLGAAQQVAEIALYLGLIICTKIIL